MTLGRDTLKDYFKAGNLPTQENFHALIDSMLHMEDEGYRKTWQSGLEVTSALGSKSLVTFFRKEDAGTPLWSLQHANDGQMLNLQPLTKQPGEKAKLQTPVLTLDNHGRVGIGQAAPRHMLHVGDFIGSKGRTGTYPLPDAKNPPQPDHGWHLLAKDLHGCVAFEVVACASGGYGAGPGRHAVLHAHALNAHNPTIKGWKGWLDRVFNGKKRIRCHNAWSSQRCDRLELAWQPWADPNDPGKRDRYALAIRSQCHYGPGATLQVQVTQLWPVPQPEPGLAEPAP
jgi:hypothetical protein